MTVLEQEKSKSSSLNMGERYITPEYLAHLPTSVSESIYFRIWAAKRADVLSDLFSVMGVVDKCGHLTPCI